MREPLKAKKMVDYLREQIVGGQLTPGSRLPALRELTEMFGLSFSTAKRGMDYLAELGLVESRAKSGAYVRSVKPAISDVATGQCKIAVVMPSHDMSTPKPGVLSTVTLGLQKEAAAAGCVLELHFIGIKDISKSKLVEISARANGVILVGEYDFALDDAGCLVPVVGVCMANNYGGKVSLLEMDIIQAAELAVEYFTGRGVANVKAVVDPLRRPAYLKRARQFMEAWRDIGGTAELCDATPRLEADFGYWFATGSLLQEAAEDWHKAGCGNLASNRVVLGLDGKHLLAPDFEPVPALAADWQMVGRCALQECLARITVPGASPRRIMFPVSLVVPSENPV